MTWITVVLFILVLIPSQAKLRDEVRIVGPTTPPNFKKKIGSLSSICPGTHPWAFDKGKFCCGKFHPPTSSLITLQWTDPLESCMPKDRIACPTFGKVGSLCLNNETMTEPILCPATHPFQMGNGCCQSYKKTNTGTNGCDGTLVNEKDDPSCCPTLFQPLDCQENRRKCISSTYAEAATYCPVAPDLIKRFGGVDQGLLVNFDDSTKAADAEPLHCMQFGGKLLDLTADNLKSALTVMQNIPGFPVGEPKRFFIDVESLPDHKYECFSVPTCQGHFVKAGTNDSVDLASLAQFPISYRLYGRFRKAVFLEIIVEPLSIFISDTTDDDTGSFICQVNCLA